jgi:hypothetical protein
MEWSIQNENEKQNGNVNFVVIAWRWTSVHRKRVHFGGELQAIGSVISAA